MNIMSVCEIALVGAIFSLILSAWQPQIGRLAGMAVILLIVGLIIYKIMGLLDLVALMKSKLAIDNLYVDIMLKMTGISLVCEITADLCIQTDSSILAKQVRMFGRVCVLYVGYPLVSQLIELIDVLLRT
ncbi:MAG: SpoIIIAC/SpoIIIAD family protein [Lachnospiraceae bacterium]